MKMNKDDEHTDRVYKKNEAAQLTQSYDNEMLALYKSSKFNTLDEVGDHLRAEFKRNGGYWTDHKINRRINFIRIKLGLDCNINDLMAQYKLDPNKKMLNPTDAEHINTVIIEMLSRDLNRLDIATYIQDYTKRSLSSAKNFIKRAIERMSDVSLRETNIFRVKRINQLEVDMNTAYKEYESCTAPNERNKWFTTYLNIQARIDSYFPNNLQLEAPELKDADQTINVSFEEVKPLLVVGSSDD